MIKRKHILIVVVAVLFFSLGGLLMSVSQAASSLAQRLAGRILLQVEEQGEAWYVDPISLERSYLGRAQDCFDVMREKGLGITNVDLEQIEQAEDTVIPDYTLGWKDYNGGLALTFKYPDTLDVVVENPKAKGCDWPDSTTACTLSTGFGRAFSLGQDEEVFVPNLSVTESNESLILSEGVDYEYKIIESEGVLVTYKINKLADIDSTIVRYEAITAEPVSDNYYKLTMWYKTGDDTKYGLDGGQVFEAILASVKWDYTQAKQTVGVATDGLGLQEIRHADHAYYYRFVFDINTQDGEVVSDIIPYTEVSYDASAKIISVIINGMRKDLTDNTISVPIMVNDTVVASYVKSIMPDDQAISYTIALNENSEYYLHSLTDPARIILDIKK